MKVFVPHAVQIFKALGRTSALTKFGSRLSAKLVERLLEAHRWTEADALLEAVRPARGDDVAVATAYALSAQRRGLHAEAVTRWYIARGLGADGPLPTSRLAESLRHVGEHSTAQTLIDEALRRYPENIRVLTEGARLAQERKRPRDAVDLWRRSIRRANPRLDWLQGYGLSLFQAGELALADRVVASARRRYPDCLDLIALQGWIATARQDWTRAIAAWTEHCRLDPSGTMNREALGEARHGAQMSVLKLDEPRPLAEVTSAPLDDEPMRRLVLCFESLGDSCELGLVQRRYGAEPLGLLRWNNVDIRHLVAALDQSFRGMGDQDNTRMITAANGELFIEDTRWDFLMQTFMFADRVNTVDAFHKLCRRIVYLRDKLLDDLRAASKIFVYRSSALDLSEVRRLHRALRSHGPATLLSVQPGHPVGSVVDYEDGLYVGFLAHLGSVDPNNNNIAFDTWITLLAAVAEKERMRSDCVKGNDAESRGYNQVSDPRSILTGVVE